MQPDDYAAKAQRYLQHLCDVKPNRRTGSAGNRAATACFADAIRSFGYEVDATPFQCWDHVRGEALLRHDDRSFEVFVSPYSLGCDLVAALTAVSTVDHLEIADCDGRLLLMTGPICSEQLLPKNFVFYNPEHHRKLVSLLEEKRPAAIITATASNPDQVGALYPYPLIVDGDFDIPSVYCSDRVGAGLAQMQGRSFRLRIEARRVPLMAFNVIAQLNPHIMRKVVITAHVDAYEDSPGASDNASGTVVLLLLAEMLSDFRGDTCVEIAALNGEDHYSAGGQMDYLRRYGGAIGNIVLAINIDDVGYKDGKTDFSFYDCAPEVEQKTERILRRFSGMRRGEPWFNGDHMIFVQQGVRSMALTAECMPELMRTVTHTALDTPDLIDCRKLVEVAQALNAVVRSL